MYCLKQVINPAQIQGKGEQTETINGRNVMCHFDGHFCIQSIIRELMEFYQQENGCKDSVILTNTDEEIHLNEHCSFQGSEFGYDILNLNIMSISQNTEKYKIVHKVLFPLL